MIILIILLVVMVGLIVASIVFDYTEVTFVPVVGMILVLIVMGILSYEIKIAETKASIINKEYGTSYTTEEIFYAESVIDAIQQIKRTRIEIQGENTRW